VGQPCHFIDSNHRSVLDRSALPPVRGGIPIETPTLNPASVSDWRSIAAQVWELRLSDPAQFAEQSHAILEEARSNNDRLEYGLACRNLGFHYFVTSEYERALNYLLEALELGRETGHETLTRDGLNYIGGVYHSLGDAATALAYVEDTMAFDQARGNTAGVASCLNNIGLLHRQLGDPQRALEYHLECNRLALELHDLPRQTSSLINAGAARLELGQVTQAIQELRQAEAISQQLEDRDYQARALENLAAALIQLEAYEEALSINSQALELFLALESRQGEAHCLINAGKALSARGDHDAALGLLQRSLELGHAIRALELQFQVHELLSTVYERKQQPALALEHFKRFHQLSREVRDDNTNRRLRASSSQREAEKTRSEAEITHLKNVELARALENLRRADQEKTQLVQALEHQVRIDPLTQLYNRRYLEQQLEAEFVAAQLGRMPLPVVMFDVDNFKGVNDTFGHQVGDAVLQVIADLMRKHKRASDIPARYGGEEFVIVMPGSTPEQARAICERLRAAVETHDWSGIHPNLRVTISLGLACDTDVANFERLLGVADQNMYTAKHGGRNQVVG
jgi:diguanylate cyclase (GGDEF)-like protein